MGTSETKNLNEEVEGPGGSGQSSLDDGQNLDLASQDSDKARPGRHLFFHGRHGGASSGSLRLKTSENLRLRSLPEIICIGG